MNRRVECHEEHRNRPLWIVLWLFLIAAGLLGCRMARRGITIPYIYPAHTSETVYDREDKVMKSLALSYFVYGCEGAKTREGTVADMLESNEMGILIENAGIRREDNTDRTTAVFDSATFISEQVGDFRFLKDLQEPGSGFYGAAFCDDQNRCVWIAYSGSVTLEDALSCVSFAIMPALSTQEECAFQLFEYVMNDAVILRDGYEIILTGHSLGGALATEVSMVTDYEACTINGADGLAVDKIGSMQTDHEIRMNISNYLTDPANGTFSFMDVVQRLMFLGDNSTVETHIYPQNEITSDPHCAFSFMKYEDGQIIVP